MIFSLPTTPLEISDSFIIIRENNLYDADWLTDQLKKKALNEVIDNKSRKRIINDFNSREHGFDDIYRVRLFAGMLLKNISSFEKGSIAKVEHDMSYTFNNLMIGDISYRDFYEEVKKEEFEIKGEQILSNAIDDITKRLVLLKVFSIILPEQLMPELVKICPFFMSCKQIQDQIIYSQYLRLNGSKSEKLEATNFLKAINSAILIDTRTVSKRKMKYWFSFLSYYEIIETISYIRHENLRNSDIEVETFLRQFKVSKTVQGLIFEKSLTPHSLAKEILIDLGLINDTSLEDFQTEIKALSKKHFAGKVDKVLYKLLDIQTITPSALYSWRVWEPFEDSR